MSSCGGGIARRRGDHDSVDKVAQFDKPIHRQPRISYNSRQPGTARHPGRKNERRTVCPPHVYMFDTAVLIPASQNKGLPGQRMKRIGDCDFLRRNPGTMSSLRIAAANAPRSCSRSSKQQGSTTSTAKPGLPTCSPASPITRSTIWPRCCRGTGASRVSIAPPDYGGASPCVHDRAAEILGEDEELLWDLADSLEPEDGCLWVHGTDNQQTIAFTDRGLECPRELIADHNRSQPSPRS